MFVFNICFILSLYFATNFGELKFIYKIGKTIISNCPFRIHTSCFNMIYEYVSNPPGLM